MAVISRDDAADEERWARYGSAPLIATLLLPIIIGVILVVKCVFNHCCVRKTSTKDEMYGLEGRVTMLPSADSNFAPLTSSQHGREVGPASSTPSAQSVRTRSPPNGSSKRASLEGEVEAKKRQSQLSTCTGMSGTSAQVAGVEGSPESFGESRFLREGRGSCGVSRLATSHDSAELAGSLKRASAQHRQLPDLPQTPAGGLLSHPPRRTSSVLSHDGTSELYATVGETPLPDAASNRSSHYAHIRENPLAVASTSLNPSVGGGASGGTKPGSSSTKNAVLRPKGIEGTPSSDSETYGNTSLHHPYAKLKKTSSEHPYARVRGADLNNDEETDTDNYDLPQFLTRQVVGAPAGASSDDVASQARPTSSSAILNAGSAGAAASPLEDEEQGPVPPRRGARWPRTVQSVNDNASGHFSGDSHDSRGYTSISVREPLSNIRSQVVGSTRSYDSHYATVSDDSEEMYAAIDDPNDSNYMRIPGDHDNNNPRRPTWLGGPNVASPIPERREANSPLPPVPPVPNVPPPELSPGPGSSTAPVAGIIPPAPLSPSSVLASSPPSATLAVSSAALPVYAQVTKKKKSQGKTPVGPTVSNASTSSSQQILIREAPLGSENPLPAPPSAKEASTSPQALASAASGHHFPFPPHHHRSKRAASLMDNSNPMDADTVDSRRWSKADISYSEFEVVRENLFPSSSAAAASNDVLASRMDDEPPPPPHHLLRSPGSGKSDVSPSSTASANRVEDLLDEDNYNIIPEKVVPKTDVSASASSANVAVVGAASGARTRLDSGNYHEIEPRNLSNTYQEIGGGCKEPSDHYQEIGGRRDDDYEDDDDEGELYQVIDKKVRKRSEDEDEEDEEDQFYEKVKKRPCEELRKKHGYEKIRRKEPSSSSQPPPPGNLSRVKPVVLGSENEEEDEDPRADQMYESVRYPPYERLNESKDDLLDAEDGVNGSDYYEDIGYSRVRPKGRDSGKGKKGAGSAAGRGQQVEDWDPKPQDVSQLYAQVDKSKKVRSGEQRGSGMALLAVDSPPPHSADNALQDISGNNNEPTLLTSMPLYSKVNKVRKSKNGNRNAATAAALDQPHPRVDPHLHHQAEYPERATTTNDNSIEYI